MQTVQLNITKCIIPYNKDTKFSTDLSDIKALPVIAELKVEENYKKEVQARVEFKLPAKGKEYKFTFEMTCEDGQDFPILFEAKKPNEKDPSSAFFIGRFNKEVLTGKQVKELSSFFDSFNEFAKNTVCDYLGPEMEIYTEEDLEDKTKKHFDPKCVRFFDEKEGPDFMIMKANQDEINAIIITFSRIFCWCYGH